MVAAFKERLQEINPGFIRFEKLQTLQVNLGDQCNMRCAHCHIGASPAGRKVMDRPVIDKIAETMERMPGITLDITGGCPGDESRISAAWSRRPPPIPRAASCAAISPS